MTLRKKTALIVGATLLALIAVLSATFRFSLMKDFRTLQESNAAESVARALEAIASETARLAAVTDDYSRWDETYAFASGRTAGLDEADILPLDGQVQVVVLFDASGRVVLARSIDAKTSRSSPLDPAQEPELLDRRLLAQGEGRGVEGVLRLRSSVLFVVTRPVFRTSGTGAPQGTLLMGRYIDPVETRVLARFANATLTVSRLDDPQLPLDTQRARSRLREGLGTVVGEEQEGTLPGYALVKDVYGNDALILRADSPPLLLRAEGESLRFLMVATLAVGLAFAGLTLYLLESLVLSRLARLSEGVEAIARAADPSVRLSIPGNDELSRLADGVNGMMGALEASAKGLAESQAKLRDVVEHSSNLFYSRSEAAVTYASPQTEDFLDCSPEEALGDWRRFLTTDPVNVDGLRSARLAFATGQRQPVYEMELRTAKGRKVRVEVDEAPVLRDGRTVAVVGALTDITARKGAEQERERLQEQLRTVQRIEAIGQLAGGVAHDFNNLLGVILGHCELLLKRSDLPDPVSTRLKQIFAAGERAAALTSRLLAFSRKQLLAPKVVDLNEIVRGIEGMLRRLIGENIELVLSLSKDLPSVRVDPGQFEQVIMNLAVNSRDAMPRGGRLIIETSLVDVDDLYIRLHPWARKGPHVMLAVSDNGEGMDEEIRSHIFEPFFTTKEVGKGTGLGLAMVYGVVKQSEGFIAVYSEIGRGTSFKIYVEGLRMAPAGSDPPLPRDPAPGGSETIVVVEDEASLRPMICEVLEEVGYKVSGFGTPEEALAVAPLRRPDLLVTDVILPKLSGPELATQFRVLSPETRVLFMSGYTDDAIAHHGVLEAGTEFISKPFTSDAFLRRVRQILDRPA